LPHCTPTDELPSTNTARLRWKTIAAVTGSLLIKAAAVEFAHAWCCGDQSTMLAKFALHCLDENTVKKSCLLATIRPLSDGLAELVNAQFRHGLAEHWAMALPRRPTASAFAPAAALSAPATSPPSTALSLASSSTPTSQTNTRHAARGSSMSVCATRPTCSTASRNCRRTASWMRCQTPACIHS